MPCRTGVLANEAIVSIVETVSPAAIGPRQWFEGLREGIETEVASADGDCFSSGLIDHANTAAAVAGRTIDLVVDAPRQVVRQLFGVVDAKAGVGSPAQIGAMVPICVF